jgi:hypothetical protein
MSSSFNANDGEISLRDLHNVVMELLTRFNQVFPPPQQNNNAQGNIMHYIFFSWLFLFEHISTK